MIPPSPSGRAYRKLHKNVEILGELQLFKFVEYW